VRKRKKFQCPYSKKGHHAPGNIEPDARLNKFFTLMTDQSGAAACCQVVEIFF